MSIATPRQAWRPAFRHVLLQWLAHVTSRCGKARGRRKSCGRAKVSEKNTDGLHSGDQHAVLEEGYIYGVCSYGQLRCLKAETGDRVWETLAATTGGKPVRWSNAFLVKKGNRFFLSMKKATSSSRSSAQPGTMRSPAPTCSSQRTRILSGMLSGRTPPSQIAACMRGTTKSWSAPLSRRISYLEGSTRGAAPGAGWTFKKGKNLIFSPYDEDDTFALMHGPPSPPKALESRTAGSHSACRTVATTSAAGVTFS